jgi:hypothetical protein
MHQTLRSEPFGYIAAVLALQQSKGPKPSKPNQEKITVTVHAWMPQLGELRQGLTLCPNCLLIVYRCTRTRSP